MLMARNIPLGFVILGVPALDRFDTVLFPDVVMLQHVPIGCVLCAGQGVLTKALAAVLVMTDEA
jgi:hypothetical protein